MMITNHAVNDCETGILQEARWDDRDREWKFQVLTADHRLLYCTSTALMRSHFWEKPFPAKKGDKLCLRIHTILEPNVYFIEVPERAGVLSSAEQALGWPRPIR
ncbi:MAG: hypothetical protein C5B50_22135 [Verrucomicrobia bacterium]|nr:MAG: hypothetical protein C5B50_22135 [Verrucomicrobiota bacterium]